MYLSKLADDHRDTFVLDGMSLIRELYHPVVLDWVCGGQWEQLRMRVKAFVAAFTRQGLRLVAFFDGAPPAAKLAEKNERNLRRSLQIASILLLLGRGCPPSQKNYLPPINTSGALKAAFLAEGVPTFEVLGEADQQIAAYCLGHAETVAGVISVDSDFFVLPSPPVVDLDWRSVWDVSMDVAGRVIFHEDVEMAVGTSQLATISALVGNDFIKPKHFFRRFETNSARRFKWAGNWISGHSSDNRESFFW